MKLLLIDAFNLIRRIFAARSGSELESVVMASKRSAQRALREHEPTHVVMVFEKHDRTWRHLLYKNYKANRLPTPEVLLDGVDEFVAGFKEIGINSFALDSYEADDVIATFASVVANTNNRAIILSSDKMYLQLLSAHIKVADHFSHQFLEQSDVEWRYGVGVGQLTDYWALVGDGSNNIKGVPGIGPKTAVKLLGQYGSLDRILSERGGDKVLDKMYQSEQIAIRCKQLVTLKTDVELGTNLRRFRMT
ncbi:MAG: flap endonuclease Xni [Pirellulales bacterium]|nr:flap endonuclease Xni [Pirellulales bacterium]